MGQNYEISVPLQAIIGCIRSPGSELICMDFSEIITPQNDID